MQRSATRTLFIVVVSVAAAVASFYGMADPVAGPAPTISTAFDQYADGQIGGVTLVHQGLYLAGPPFTARVDSFVPAALGLDAVDVQDDGSLLFSTEQTGLVAHAAGYLRVEHDRVYRFDPAQQTIAHVHDWSDHGVEIDSLDALDRLDDGTILFSTEFHRFVAHAAGSTTLRPENVYRFDPATGAIELMLDGRALGLRDLDAVHRLGPGVFAISTATDHQVAQPDGGVHIRHEDICLVDGAALAIWFAGQDVTVQSVDALSMPGARAAHGLALIPSGATGELREDDPAAAVEYFVTLTRRPDQTTTIDLSSPDGQVGCTPDRLSFTPYDWLLPWTVRAHAIDDRHVERGLHRGRLAHTAVSGDPRWTDVELPMMSFTIRDNDASGANLPQPQVADPASPLELDRRRDRAEQGMRPRHDTGDHTRETRGASAGSAGRRGADRP